MASTQPTQAFYALTLMPSTAPTAAVCCNVIPGLKQQDQQIFEARGSRLYLRRIQENAERTDIFVTTVFEQEIFANVRHIGACRVPGEDHDHIFIDTDSGRIGMYEYDAENNKMKQVHLESFGKSGIRRTIPGQYLAVDPTGRCLMMASTEKNKIVYMFQRTPQGVIIISSPHEANSWATLTFDICALDTAWENPAFAALEVDFSELENNEDEDAYEYREKVLSIYTVDLGLNHVVKSWSDTVDYSANKVFGLPGGANGPSGVLVCARGRLYFRHPKFEPLSVQIPRRAGPCEDPNRDRIIVAGTVHINRSRQDFFYLLQTDDGDIFKLTMVYGTGEKVPQSMEIRYYETFPIASQLLLIRKGYLVVNSESGPTKIYHVDNLAEDPEVEPENVFSSETCSPDPREKLEPVYFRHRKLKYCTDMVDIPAMHPLIKTRVDNIVGDDAPQILSIQGSENDSSFKLIRHGLAVEVDASIEQGNIAWDGVFALKDHIDDDQTKWLVVTSKYADRSMILKIDGDDINGVDESPFMHNRHTILAAMMGEETKIQVMPRILRTIKASGAITTWNPSNCLISCADANSRQLLLGLSSGELAFFFMSEEGELSELQEHPEMTAAITAIGLSNTPKGQMQARFAVVGCEDHSVRVMSIELDSPLEVRSIQAVSDVPTSIVVVEMLDPNSNSTVSVVHIGLKSGIYLRAIIDEVTGELSEVRSKFLGSRQVRIFPAELQGQQCVVLCSSKPWLGYHHPVTKQYTVTPMITPWLDAVCPFKSEAAAGLCGVANNELRFVRPTNLESKIVTDELKLANTPRALARHPTTGTVYVVGCDANRMSVQFSSEVLMRANQLPYNEDAPQKLFRMKGHWASSIQSLDPVVTKKVHSTIYLDSNEAALCCNVVQFKSQNWQNFLIVGTGRNMPTGLTDDVDPKLERGGFLHVYKISEDGNDLTFMYKNETSQPVYALAPFQGRVAVGIGRELMLYDLGVKNILRKSRDEIAAHRIVSIEARGDRFVVGDVRESVTYVYYKQDENRFIAFADDTVPRWVTASTMVDYDTTAGGDKFGNLWIVRVPEIVSRDIDDPESQAFIISERPYLQATANRLEPRAHYYVRDIPTTVQRTALLAGSEDVLYWSGIQGTIGVLVPFFSRRDVDFFGKLEVAMRAEVATPGGRDHLAYRSYYAAVRSVYDGDLCEMFSTLSYDGKLRVAGETDRSVPEIEKKIQEMRTRVAF